MWWKYFPTFYLSSLYLSIDLKDGVEFFKKWLKEASVRLLVIVVLVRICRNVILLLELDLMSTFTVWGWALR